MWWMTGAALACAGLVHEPLETAESDGSEVLFEDLGDGFASVTYATRYTGSAAEFGWIIPVPGEVSTIEDADPTVFAELRSLTDPWIGYPEPEPSGGGCHRGKGGDLAGGTRSSQGDVDVVAQGYTGTYDYVVVTSDDPGALDAWLSENGWDAGATSEDVAAYVAAGWPIAALRIHAEAGAADPTELPPLRISYAGPLTYPLGMARHATEPEQALTIYVRGAADVAEGWTIAGSDELQTSGDPLDAWADHLRDVGADASFQRTWAGQWDGAVLTRLDAIVASDADLPDPVFTTDGTVEGASFTVFVSGSGEAWMIGLVGLGWLARRARRP